VKKVFTLYNGVFLLFFLFIGMPVLYTFFSTFVNISSLTNDIASLGFDSFILLAKSIFIAAIIALFAVVLGAVLAFILYKTDLKYQSVFKLLLITPLFISPYILAVAWKDLLFYLLGNQTYMSSYFALITVLTIVYTPLSMLIIGSSLNNISSHIEESALLLADTKSLIRRIILPLLKPALFSSFALIFIFSISNFAVPAFFGVKLFTTEIFTQFSAFYKHSFAIVQSSILVIVCIALLIAEFRYIAEAPYMAMGSRGVAHKIYKLHKWETGSLLLVLIWLIISIMLPLIVLAFQSFSSGGAYFIKAFELLQSTFAYSIILALVASVFILSIGLVIAYNEVVVGRNTRMFNSLLLLVFTIPSTVFGISLIKYYNQPSLNFIYASAAIIIIAFVGKFSFIATKLISNSLKQIPKSLNESAIIMGVKPAKILLKILMPMILPALSASFMISFIFSLGELGTIIMVYPPGSEIMPLKVFTIMANAPQSLTSSMILLVFSITLFMVLGLSFIARFINNKYSYVHN